MARRGFLAELNYQAAQAEKRQRQAATAAARQQAAAVREHERAVRAAERAEAQRVRSAAASAKAAEREAKQLYLEARLAEVEELNAALTAQYEDIDSMLTWTLSFDDFVDLERLRRTVDHPRFPRPDLQAAIPPPPPLQAPPEPMFIKPETIKGLFSKKKNAEALAVAQAAFDGSHKAWEADVAKIPARQLEQMKKHQEAEEARQRELAKAQAAYEAKCRACEEEVATHNKALDRFAANLAANDPDAVNEYVGLVVAQSVYPDCFVVEHEFDYDPATRELSLRVAVPPPADLPAIKEYKYNKSRDEITTTALTQKAQRERYTNAICQVALRSFHEMFEADRDRRIQTIALSLSASGTDAGTGLPITATLIAAAADRDVFDSFDLDNVVPALTLERLNATVSKNPFGLVSIDTGPGVRG